jgi:hypothetical protein
VFGNKLLGDYFNQGQRINQDIGANYVTRSRIIYNIRETTSVTLRKVT